MKYASRPPLADKWLIREKRQNSTPQSTNTIRPKRDSVRPAFLSLKFAEISVRSQQQHDHCAHPKKIPLYKISFCLNRSFMFCLNRLLDLLLFIITSLWAILKHPKQRETNRIVNNSISKTHNNFRNRRKFLLLHFGYSQAHFIIMGLLLCVPLSDSRLFRLFRLFRLWALKIDFSNPESVWSYDVFFVF